MIVGLTLCSSAVDFPEMYYQSSPKSHIITATDAILRAYAMPGTMLCAS